MNTDARVQSEDSRLTLPDLGLVVLLVVCASGAAVLLKSGASSFAGTWNALDFLSQNWKLITGYSLYLLPSLITVLLYKKYKVGYIQAMISTVYITTPALAWLVGVEQMNGFKLVGIGIIFLTVLFLIKSGGAKDESA